jgi:hypothetical protein
MVDLMEVKRGVIAAIFPTRSSDDFASASTIDKTPNAMRPVDFQGVLAYSLRTMRGFL